MEIDVDSEILNSCRKDFVNNLQLGMDSELVRSSFLANTKRNLENYNSWIHPDEPLRVYEKKYGGGIVLSTQPYTIYPTKGHFYVTKDGVDLKRTCGRSC